MIASCDQSLFRLGIPYVDIFYIDRFDPNTPLGETMLALDQIVRSGRALYVGLSNYPLDVALEAYHILKSLNTPLIVHQDSHSLLSAADKYDEMVEEISSYGLGAFSPLAQGLLSNTLGLLFYIYIIKLECTRDNFFTDTVTSYFCWSCNKLIYFDFIITSFIPRNGIETCA